MSKAFLDRGNGHQVANRRKAMAFALERMPDIATWTKPPYALNLSVSADLQRLRIQMVRWLALRRSKSLAQQIGTALGIRSSSAMWAMGV